MYLEHRRHVDGVEGDAALLVRHLEPDCAQRPSLVPDLADDLQTRLRLTGQAGLRRRVDEHAQLLQRFRRLEDLDHRRAPVGRRGGGRPLRWGW